MPALVLRAGAARQGGDRVGRRQRVRPGATRGGMVRCACVLQLYVCAAPHAVHVVPCAACTYHASCVAGNELCSTSLAPAQDRSRAQRCRPPSLAPAYRYLIGSSTLSSRRWRRPAACVEWSTVGARGRVRRALGRAAHACFAARSTRRIDRAAALYALRARSATRPTRDAHPSRPCVPQAGCGDSTLARPAS